MKINFNLRLTLSLLASTEATVQWTNEKKLSVPLIDIYDCGVVPVCPVIYLPVREYDER
jgi:hypothetical protein